MDNKEKDWRSLLVVTVKQKTDDTGASLGWKRSYIDGQKQSGDPGSPMIQGATVIIITRFKEVTKRQ